jgi:hypothetical protein
LILQQNGFEQRALPAAGGARELGSFGEIGKIGFVS